MKWKRFNFVFITFLSFLHNQAWVTNILRLSSISYHRPNYFSRIAPVMCQFPIKTLKNTCNSKLKSTELKDLFIKRVLKNQSKRSNSKTSNFQQKISLRIMDFCFDWYCWQWRYYPRCYKVNDAKTLKTLVVSFYTLCFCSLNLGLLKTCWFSAAYYRILFFSFAKGQQPF